MENVPRKNNFISLYYITIIVAIVIIYSNTFNVPFQFDDNYNIVETPIIKNIGYYTKLEMTNPTQFHVAFKTRYITFLSFALNFKAGKLNVTGYHIVNLIIHIANAVLVYLLVVLSFRTPFLQLSYLKDYSNLIALFSALIFGCHPIATMAVTYITQRFTSLATLFYLLSFISYIRWRLGTSPNFKSLIFYLLSIVFAVLAMKTKEIAFTLPVAIIFYELMFFRGDFKKRILYLIAPFLTILVIPITLINMTRPLGEIISDVPEVTRVQTMIPRFDYLFTQFRVVATYLRLIFLPINQNIDYDYPVYNSFFNYNVFLSFLLIIGMICLGVYLYFWNRNRDAISRLISYGILWFFITLSVESSFIPLADVINEYRLYLPSTGFFPVLITGLFILIVKSKNIKLSKVIIFSLVFVLATLSYVTYNRNNVWRTEKSLWEDTVNKSPNKARAHNNLGIAYQAEGNFSKAIEHYEAAIKLNPSFGEVFNNSGNIYFSEGKIDEAIKHYSNVLQLEPNSAKAYYNLGVALAAQEKFKESIQYYYEALRINPHDEKTHNNLGIALAIQGRINEAIHHYREALRINPHDEKTHINLGIALANQGKFNEAVSHYYEALRANPDDEKTHNYLGSALLMQHKLREAKRHFREALELNSSFPDALNSLAWILATAEDQDIRNGIEALKFAQKACSLTNYSDPYYLDTLAAAYAEMGSFDKATEVATRAKELAISANAPGLAKGIESRILLYRSLKPYRE